MPPVTENDPYLFPYKQAYWFEILNAAAKAGLTERSIEKAANEAGDYARFESAPERGGRTGENYFYWLRHERFETELNLPSTIEKLMALVRPAATQSFNFPVDTFEQYKGTSQVSASPAPFLEQASSSRVMGGYIYHRRTPEQVAARLDRVRRVEESLKQLQSFAPRSITHLQMQMMVCLTAEREAIEKGISYQGFEADKLL